MAKFFRVAIVTGAMFSSFHGWGQMVETAETRRELFKNLIELAQAPEDFYFYLAAGKISLKGLKNVIADQKKRQIAYNQPLQVTLSSANEIMVGGSASGVRITSFLPFEVTYKQRVWAYNKNQSSEKTYFSLLHHLEQKPKVAFTPFWSEAWADDFRASGTVALAISASVSQADESAWPTWLRILVTGRTFRSRESIIESGIKGQWSVVGSVLASDFDVECDDQSVKIRPKGDPIISYLRFDKIERGDDAVKIFDANESRIDVKKNVHLTSIAAITQIISYQLMQCKNLHDAQQLKDFVCSYLRFVQEAEARKDPPFCGGSSHATEQVLSFSK